MTKKTVCRVRIPPVADKATAIRTEAKALMRGLLEEMGVPALVTKVEAQEAELCRMRQADNHLFERLQSNVRGWGSQSDNAMRLDKVLEALLEYLTVMLEGGGGELETELEPTPTSDLGLGRMLTDEQNQEAIRRLMDGPSLLRRFSPATTETRDAINGLGSDFYAWHESDATITALQQLDTPNVVRNPDEPDGEEEDPIGDLEM